MVREVHVSLFVSLLLFTGCVTNSSATEENGNYAMASYLVQLAQTETEVIMGRRGQTTKDNVDHSVAMASSLYMAFLRETAAVYQRMGITRPKFEQAVKKAREKIQYKGSSPKTEGKEFDYLRNDIYISLIKDDIKKDLTRVDAFSRNYFMLAEAMAHSDLKKQDKKPDEHLDEMKALHTKYMREFIDMYYRNDYVASDAKGRK